MSVSYKMKHAKQHAWTIEEKNEDGSKTGANLKQKVIYGAVTVPRVFALMVVIGLISAMIVVTYDLFAKLRQTGTLLRFL